MTAISELISRWDSGDGKPYKGNLIDWAAYEADPSNIGCMCAQGQVLHRIGGWSPERLRYTDQPQADSATAKLLNISTAHSILLRHINDRVEGAPSIVLTNPEKLLGDQAQTVLAFWLHLDRMTNYQWNAAGHTARNAALDAARAAAWAAAGDAAGLCYAVAARYAALRTARNAAPNASNEIQGARIMRERGQPFYFLPMFGFADPEAIPPLPADYGVRA